MHKFLRNIHSLLKTTLWRLSTVLAVWAAAADLAAWDHQKDILGNYRYLRRAVLPEGNENSSPFLPAIRLDSAFYARINDLSNDVMMLDSQSNVLQFVLNRVTGNTTVWSEEQLPGKVVQSQLLPDGKSILEFELDGSISSISSVEIAGDSFPAGSLITIAVSNDGIWQEVLTRCELADISQFYKTPNRRFPLPEAVQGKIIRITLEKAAFSGKESVRVYTSVSKEQPETPLISEYPVTIRRNHVASKWIFLDIATANQPLTQLKINTSTPFFLCPVLVYGSNDRMQWTQLADTTIHRINMDTANTVDFPEFRGQYIQIQIEHPIPGEALQDVQIQAFGNTYEWLLSPLNNAASQLTVYYGATERTPQLKTNSMIVSGQNRTFLNLSGEQLNPASSTGIQARRTWRYSTGALLIIATAITVWTILFSLKKNSRVLPED